MEASQYFRVKSRKKIMDYLRAGHMKRFWYYLYSIINFCLVMERDQWMWMKWTSVASQTVPVNP